MDDNLLRVECLDEFDTDMQTRRWGKPPTPNRAAGGAGDCAGNKCRGARGVAGSGEGGPETDGARGNHG